ncbi:MAG: type I methionyl aminopeptidase [bacterium]|nr:type I methionyl aminopeptidase [bacterium]
MIITNPSAIENLREGGKKLAEILRMVVSHVKPGVMTIELDQLAEEAILKAGGRPSFKNYKTEGTRGAYPATLCVSLNNEIVHGIPGRYVIKEGDVVSLDIGMQYKQIFTDTALTVSVGDVGEDVERLIRATKRSLDVGIEAAGPDVPIGTIGSTIQNHLEGEGFGVVRELVGHGVGADVHEEPEIPNWGTEGQGEKLVPGMVLALEPMATLGSPDVSPSEDGWVWSTADGSMSAHFEHTILITENGREIITK